MAGLTVGGGLLVLFVDGILLSQLLARLSISGVVDPVWSFFATIGAALTGTGPVDVDAATGSDMAWAWQFHLGWIVVALAGSAVWAMLDRDHPDLRGAYRALSGIAAISLAVAMLIYGLAKAVPIQMGYMNLPAHQLQSVGDTGGFSMLWGSMAASTPYTVITGMIEVASGILLLFRRTRPAGAMLAIVALTQIVLLNLFYDVPVKLLSLELLLTAVALTTPSWPALLRIILPRSTSGGPLWARAAVVTAVLAVMAAVGAQNVDRWRSMDTPRSPLDGTWRATSFTVDGAPALAASSGPVWTAVAITLRGTPGRPAQGSAQDSVVTQRPDGTVQPFGLTVSDGALLLRSGAGAAPVRLAASQRSPDSLSLSGDVDGRRIEGTYQRRAMARESTEIRLVQPPVDRSRPRV